MKKFLFLSIFFVSCTSMVASMKFQDTALYQAEKDLNCPISKLTVSPLNGGNSQMQRYSARGCNNTVFYICNENEKTKIITCSLEK